MVKARGPSKGADWLARDRGLIRPQAHSSSSLFSRRGNPWLTKEEQNREYPLNRSLPGDQPETEFETRGRDIRRKMKEGLGEEFKDFKGPRPSVVVDPDFDRYERALPVVPKEKYVDPKGKKIEPDAALRRAQLMMRLNRGIRTNGGRLVEHEDPRPKAEKVRGNFYDFSSAPMTDEKKRRMRDKRKKGRRK